MASRDGVRCQGSGRVSVRSSSGVMSNMVWLVATGHVRGGYPARTCNPWQRHFVGVGTRSVCYMLNTVSRVAWKGKPGGAGIEQAIGG